MQFSIIVPVYNTEPFLEACVASVRAQCVDDWEMILIDDGSTDGSGALLNQLGASEPRLRVVHKENRGQFFARQTGIGMARGRYLLFLDSDDTLAPDALAELSRIIQDQTPDLILFAGFVCVEGKRTDRRIGDLGQEERQVEVRWLRESLIRTNDLNSLCLKAFRRELFDGDETDYSAFLGEHFGEDKVRLLYPVTRAERIVYCPRGLYEYNHRAESAMHRYSLDRAEGMLCNEMFDMLRRYMVAWGMTGREQTEALDAYYSQNMLSVYYGIRKTCRTVRERSAFRAFPWGKITDGAARRGIFNRALPVRDRLRAFFAALRL